MRGLIQALPQFREVLGRLSVHIWVGGMLRRGVFGGGALGRFCVWVRLSVRVWVRLMIAAPPDASWDPAATKSPTRDQGNRGSTAAV